MREAKKHRTIARVIATDEKNNTCMIKYRDRDGGVVHEKEAYVKISLDTSGWFPQTKDIVFIEKEGEDVIIVDLYEPTYNTNTRERRKLKEDVYPDHSGNLAGNIL